jgi:ubiquitin-conjugating enzyme E2 M
MWKLAANLAKEEEIKKQEEAQEKEKETTTQAEGDVNTPVVRVGSKDLSDSRKKLKEEQAKEQATKSVDIKKKGGNTRKRDPTDIRLMTELSNLDLSAVPGVEICHPDKRNQKIFDVNLIPQDGLWKGAKFKFNVKTPNGYPHEAPNVTCDTRVYHPNIDLQGKVGAFSLRGRSI